MIISATDLKNNVSKILNKAYFGGVTTIIEKHGIPIAKIVPINDARPSREELKKAIKETFGSIPDFPDVTKFRVPRKKYPKF